MSTMIAGTLTDGQHALETGEGERMEGQLVYDLRNLPDRPKDFLSSDEDLSYLEKQIARLKAEGRSVFFVLAREELHEPPITARLTR